jgi:hypothetical protein
MAYGINTPPTYAKTDDISFLEWFRQITKFANSLYTVKSASSTYTVDVDSSQIKTNVSYVRADASGGAFTVTLPVAADNLGRKILIKKIDSSANAVTISGTGSDTIEGSATKSLSSQWSSLYLIAGTSGSWEII